MVGELQPVAFPVMSLIFNGGVQTRDSEYEHRLRGRQYFTIKTVPAISSRAPKTRAALMPCWAKPMTP